MKGYIFFLLCAALSAYGKVPHVTGRNPELPTERTHHPREVIVGGQWTGTIADLDCDGNGLHTQSPFEGDLIEMGFASVGELYHGNDETACSKGYTVFDIRDLDSEPCYLNFQVEKAGGLFKQNPLAFKKEDICVYWFSPECPSANDQCRITTADYNRIQGTGDNDLKEFARISNEDLVEGATISIEATSVYAGLVGQGCLAFVLDVCHDNCEVGEWTGVGSDTSATRCQTEGRAWTFTNFSLDDEEVAAAGEDPHFVGFNGQRYDVMGQNGKIYNIISDEDFMMNARVVEGCREYRSVFGEVAIKYLNHKISFNANGSAKLEGYHVEANHKWALSADGEEYMILHPATQGKHAEPARLEVVTKDYKVNLEASNQRRCTQGRVNFSVVRKNLESKPHGLLGVTARRMDLSRNAYGHHLDGIVEGNVQDYEIRDADMFGHDFEFNQWHHNPRQMHRAGKPKVVDHETREAPSDYSYARVTHPHQVSLKRDVENRHVEI